MVFMDFLNILIKNVFFLKPDFRGTHFLTKKLNLLFVYLASIVGLSKQSGRIYPITLQICMLYYMNYIFRYIVF